MDTIDPERGGELGPEQLGVMVLVAVAIGTAWVYSVAATFFIEGDVFYEAAAMLATFVLLGHWFEMRARRRERRDPRAA